MDQIVLDPSRAYVCTRTRYTRYTRCTGHIGTKEFLYQSNYRSVSETEPLNSTILIIFEYYICLDHAYPILFLVS